MKSGYDAVTGRTRKAMKGLDCESLAIEALGFLAADPDRIGAFLTATGLDPASLRTAARNPGFAEGVLGYLAGDESLLVSFAESQGLSPETLGMAIARLLHPPGID